MRPLCLSSSRSSDRQSSYRTPRLAAAALPLGIALFVGCGKSAAPVASDLEFAHFQSQTLLGGTFGRVVAAERRVPGADSTVDICVESGVASYPVKTAILESKIAYAAWLDAAGFDVAALWPSLKFSSADSCAGAAPLDAAVRILGPDSPVESFTADGDSNERFQPQTMTCATTDRRRTCNATNLITGLGRPGTYRSWFNSQNGRWTKVEFAGPTSARLSHHVDWVDMGTDLRREASSGVNGADRLNLAETYDRLAGVAEPSASDLVSFSRDLAAANAISSGDPEFSAATERFFSSRDSALTAEIRGRRAAWQTLFHEVGHTIGLDHADNPSRDSITGESAGATQNANGQWVTDLSGMAYALEYLYPTADDAAGARSVRKHVEEFLKEKFGN